MTSVTGFVLGTLVGLGALLIVVGLVGVEDRPARHQLAMPDLNGVLLRGGGAALAGLLLSASTGWLAAFPAAVVAVLVAPEMIGAKARRERVIARTEAVAAWAEMLRDTMAASAGLQAAIAASARVAPPPIRAEVRDLANSIQREDLPTALRSFAAAVDDPAADIVALALIVAATKQARHVGEVLDRAAVAARASASMRTSVEAGRARTFVSARVIVAVTVGMAALIAVFSNAYLEPFDSSAGQLVLVVIAALFGTGLWSLSRLARLNAGPRVLIAAEHL